MKDFFRVVLCATVLLSSTAAIAQCPNGMVIRKEFRQLSLVEWEKFVDAVRALNVGPTPTLYDRQVAIRKGKKLNNYMSLPFNRLYLRDFEEKLQEQEHDTTISLPYWDWSLDAYDPDSSPIFTAGWLGGNGAPGTHTVTDGPFANWPVFYPQPHRLRRDFGAAPGTHFADEAALRELIASTVPDGILDNYTHFREGLERMASEVPVWIGGDMGRNRFSPNDPIFWLHRAFVDKLWAERQKFIPQFANDFPLSTTSRVPHYSIPVSEVFDTEHLCYNYDAFVFE